MNLWATFDGKAGRYSNRDLEHGPLGRSAELRERAWNYLESHVRPDVALVQEAVPCGRERTVVCREAGIRDDRVDPPRDLDWGSGIVSYGPSLQAIDSVTLSQKSIPLLGTLPGAVAIAEVADGHGFVVVSAYGVIDAGGYAETTVHRILSDLTPLIDDRNGQGIVLAGDLNITTQWSSKHQSLQGWHEEYLQRDRNVFERFKALGLQNLVVRTAPDPLPGCDCSAGSACAHVQTQRHDRSSFPWQNDYFFVTEDLAERVVSVEVFDEDAAWELSGHCPIAVEFADQT